MRRITGYPKLEELRQALVNAFGVPERIVDDMTGPVDEEWSRHILNDDLDQLSVHDYSVALTEGSVAQKAYLLPAAISHARNRWEAWDMILEYAVRCAGSYISARLVEAGLYDRVFAEIEAIFWDVLACYRCTAHRTHAPGNGLIVEWCVDDGDVRDSLLNELSGSASSVADRILTTLVSGQADEKRSAHFLDMVFRWKRRRRDFPEIYGSLHGNCVFRAALGDHELQRRHWQVAGGLIEKACMPEYLAAVREMIET